MTDGSFNVVNYCICNSYLADDFKGHVYVPYFAELGFDEYFDLFANEDEFEDWVEEMWDWFNTVEEMTPEQVELIEQLKLDRLYKETIM